MLSHFSHVHLFETLWTIAHQTLLSMGFPRQYYWCGLPFPSLGDLPAPGIEPSLLRSPALAGKVFTTGANWEIYLLLNINITIFSSIILIYFIFYVVSLSRDIYLVIIYFMSRSKSHNSNDLGICIFVVFSSVQSFSRVWLFATPWTAARKAYLSVTNSRSSLRLMSIETMMPSNHLILSRPLLLPPSIFPSSRVFSNESALCRSWPKYWSFSFIISPSMNTQDWSPSGWTGWILLQSKGLSRVFPATVQKHQFFITQLSL